MRGSPLPRRLAAAVAVTALAAIAGPAATRGEPAPRATSGPASAPCAAAPVRDGPMRAAHYFGSASPANFWNSSLERLERDLARVRDDGFDTIVLVVPWREFQPGLAPPRYNARAFRRLDRILGAACRAGLGVALRVSYFWDFYAAGEPSLHARAHALYADGPVYRGWLAYVERVGAVARRHPNFRLAFLTWEDFWPAIDHAGWLGARPTPTERIAYARAVGFQRWLAGRYSLGQVSELYGEPFTAWAEVPTPKRDSPAFRLFFEFHDHTLVERFFAPARARFPGLSLEVRVDLDPIFDGGQAIGWHDHSAMFALPETDVAVVYWSPSMGATNQSDQATAEETLARLEWMLGRMEDGAAGRRLFLDQFNFLENHPLFARNTVIAEDELGEFLVAASGLLAEHTDGYGVWTYRDYRADAAYNSSFSLGAEGWTLDGPARIVPRGSGRALVLARGGSARQSIPKARDPAGRISSRVRVTFRAWPRGAGATLRVRIGALGERTVRVARGRTWYAFTAPVARLRSYTLRFRAGAGAPVVVDDVRVFSFVQEGRIRAYDGRPGPALDDVRELNRRLAASSGA